MVFGRLKWGLKEVEIFVLSNKMVKFGYHILEQTITLKMTDQR